jgi:hypothetical protein
MRQGADEVIRYTVDVSPWCASNFAAVNALAPIFTAVSAPSASTLSALQFKLFELPAVTDVTATKTTGSASASGQVITTPFITSLVAGTQYRGELKFTADGNTYECMGIWIGE